MFVCDRVPRVSFAYDLVPHLIYELRCFQHVVEQHPNSCYRAEDQLEVLVDSVGRIRGRMRLHRIRKETKNRKAEAHPR